MRLWRNRALTGNNSCGDRRIGTAAWRNPGQVRRFAGSARLPVLASLAVLLASISPSLSGQRSSFPVGLQIAAKAASNYVDPQVCAACHQQIYQDYIATGMARSFYRPLPSNMIENYTKPDYY